MAGATFSDIRSLHSLGSISVKKEVSGQHPNKFLTCGTDGTVYIWNMNTFTSEKTAAEIKNVGEQTYSIVTWSGNNAYFGYLQMDLISGLDLKRIGVAPIENLEDVTPLLSFNLEPTAIDSSKEYLVAGSSEFIIKAIKLDGKVDLGSAEVSGEVLCVKIDPKEEFAAVSISDGSLQIFALKSDLPEIANIPKVFPSINTISIDSPKIEITWSKDGEVIYVPHLGSVKKISRSNWKVVDEPLKAPGRELEAFSVSCLSPCGNFLAATTMKNYICFWNIKTSSFLNQIEYKRSSPGKTIITSIEFSSSDSLIVADSNEGMTLLKQAISKKAEVENQEEPIVKSKNKRLIVESDDEEDDGDFIAPVVVEDDDENTRMSTDIGALKKSYGFENRGTLDDYLIRGEEELKDDINPETSSKAPVVQTITQVVEYEPPSIPSHFTSGASPNTIISRYLKWNRVGMIRSVKDEETNNIEIEFHNSSIHSEIIFENAANYLMGDLSEEAIALANVSEDETEQSELWVYHVTAWDGGNRKWSTNLPLKENPIDVLVSQKLIGVLTNYRNLRLFTLQGTQRHIISHPGPSLTATCFNTTFVIISIAGSEYHEESKEKRIPQHNYIATVYNLDSKNWFQSKSNVTTVNVAVKPGETVTWAGYTNEGKLCVMDSSYSVRILTKGGLWVPIFEGSSIVRSKSDALWPIAVVDGATKQFRYLYCRGSKHPLISLKQTPTVAPWSLSLCQAESEKSKLEGELLLNELDQNDAILSNKDIQSLVNQHLQCIVKLFALACKSERETRAWELSHLVSSSKGIQALVNFASKSRRNVLSDKIANYARDNLAGTAERPPSREQDDFLGPKRTIARRPTTNTNMQYNIQSQSDIFSDSQNDVANMDSIRESQNTSLLEVTLVSPAAKVERNPFKRNAETSQEMINGRSVFDQLEEENPRKRVKEDHTVKQLTSKQTKLAFGKGKENNKITPYNLWLEENESEMKDFFEGDSMDFEKFCMGKFKTLSAAEKKELRERVDALSRGS